MNEQLLKKFSRSNLHNITQQELIDLDSNVRAQLLFRLTNEIHSTVGEVQVSEIWEITDKFAVKILLHCLINLDETSKEFVPFGKSPASIYSNLRSLWFTIRFSGEESKYDYYLIISNIIEDFIVKNILPSVLKERTSDSFFMTKFILAFKKIQHVCSWIHNLFHKIEEYVMKDFLAPSFTSLAMYFFSEKLVKPCEERLALSIHNEISRERNGGVVNAEEISDCINILQLMGSCKDVKFFKNAPNLKNFTRNESYNAYNTYYRAEIQRRNNLIPNNQLNNTNLILQFPESYCTNFRDFNKLPHDLSFYVAGFEKKFLEVSKEYFSSISIGIESSSVEDYILKAQKIEKEEIARAIKYLHSTTRPKLEIVCMNQLFLVNREKIMLNASHTLKEFYRSDSKGLPDTSKCNHLKRLFHTIIQCTKCNPDDSTFDLLTEFSELFSEEVKLKIEELFVKKIENAPTLQEIKEKKEKKQAAYPKFTSDISFIHDIIHIYQRTVFLVETFFDKNPLCCKRSLDSFVKYLNNPIIYEDKKINCHFQDFIVDYGDKILQNKLLKDVEDSEKALCIYCYAFFSMIIEKDRFIDAWGNSMASRIINGNLKNYVLEDLFIQTSIFDKSSDQSMWQKCTSMLNHFQESPALNEEFQKSLESSNDSLPIQFSSLTQNFVDWTKHISIDANKIILPDISLDLLPSVLRECNIKYNEWYLDKFNGGRNLKWVYEYGGVEMEIRISKKKYLFNFPSTLQAIIAMIFSESSGPIKFDDIKQRTNINDDILKRALDSLCKPIKKNKDSTFLIQHKQTNSYSFNNNFESKFTMNPIFKFPKEEKENNVGTSNQLQEQRKLLIDCAIVRIMKARREFEHKQLMLETISQVKNHFNPDIKLIKTRIENLIERDYLKKTISQGNFSYTYLP
jgi:hypothetical protein